MGQGSFAPQNNLCNITVSAIRESILRWRMDCLVGTAAPGMCKGGIAQVSLSRPAVISLGFESPEKWHATFYPKFFFNELVT